MTSNNSLQRCRRRKDSHQPITVSMAGTSDLPSNMMVPHNRRGRKCIGSWQDSRIVTRSGSPVDGRQLYAEMEMAPDAFLPASITGLYEVHQWRHAVPLLATVHPVEWKDILKSLASFRVRKSHIEVGGKSKSKLSAEFDSSLYSLGWKEKKFDTAIVLDGVETPSPTHKIDCFKNRVALELEWNNKTEFYDRDLNNFRLLFELRAIDIGVVVTRCDELQNVFESLGRGSSYGNSTTILSKLLYKVDGGGAGGCPVVAFGMRAALYDPTS